MIGTMITVCKPVPPQSNSVLYRERPFNLQGGGSYRVFFRSEFFFRTTQELEYIFFVAQSANFFS